MEIIEEYDADINFHFIKWDNGQIELTSDVDDDFEYFDEMERVCIIVNLINDLFKQIYDGIENFNENDDEYIQKVNFGTETRDTLIKTIINLCYNLRADKTQETHYMLEFGLAIYKSLIHKKTKETTNIVGATSYSDEISLLEPANGSFAFLMDSAECMLDNNFPKESVKAIMQSIIKHQSEYIDEFINDYKKEN